MISRPRSPRPCWRWRGNDPGRAEAVLEQLAGLVEKTPLAPLADGVRANARERAEAASQIPLWLVARACRKQPSLPPKGQAHADRFAARALEAAGRQEDRVWLLAMMREQGQLAFERNDRAAAAAVWSRMLEMVVAPREARARRPAPNQAARRAPPGRGGDEILGGEKENPSARRTVTAMAGIRSDHRFV